jgi:hypothetical protein
MQEDMRRWMNLWSGTRIQRECPVMSWSMWTHLMWRKPPAWKKGGLRAGTQRWVTYQRDKLKWEVPGFKDGFLYSPTGLVAQPYWPEPLRAAFNLDDPPTPYEVACEILAPRMSYYQKAVREPYHQRGWSDFHYWLMGYSPENIGLVRGMRGEEVMLRMSAAVTEAMSTNVRFALWALGTDLTGLGRTHAQRSILKDVSLRGKWTEGSKDRSGVLGLPQIRAQLLGGVCFAPIRPRRVWKPGAVWETKEAREADPRNHLGRHRTLRILRGENPVRHFERGPATNLMLRKGEQRAILEA